MRPKLRMVPWNSEGFKVGLCSEPPLTQPYSLLCLSNNCCIRDVFRYHRVCVCVSSWALLCWHVVVMTLAIRLVWFNCSFSGLHDKFSRLYRSRAHVHNYAKHMDPCMFDEVRGMHCKPHRMVLTLLLLLVVAGQRVFGGSHEFVR